MIVNTGCVNKERAFECYDWASHRTHLLTCTVEDGSSDLEPQGAATHTFLRSSLLALGNRVPLPLVFFTHLYILLH